MRGDVEQSMSTRRVLRVCLRLLVRVMFDTYARFPQKFVIASLTRLDVSGFDLLGKEGKAALREAIEGRSGFELLL